MSKIVMAINLALIAGFAFCLVVSGFHLAHGQHLHSDPFWIYGQFFMIGCLAFIAVRKFRRSKG